jgi:DNA polymerase I-like protein with 3'-5' exonuclease and polymerase domains
LYAADTIVGHNIIGFDCPALAQLGYKDLQFKAVDTLNMSRLIIPEMLNYDIDNNAARKWKLPKDLYGSHSLKAWGYRLGLNKGTFGETTDWEEWSPEMQSYCELDVDVVEKLYYFLQSFKPTELSLSIEMAVQRVITQQELEGVPFDYNLAMSMKDTISNRIAELKDSIHKVVPTHSTFKPFTPKRNNATKGYIAGKTIIRETIKPFNPNSRIQLLKYLKDTYGFVPTKKTKKGTPSLDAEELEALGGRHPEVTMFHEYLTTAKLASQLYGGDKAWLNFVINGRIHGRVVINGAMTGRATHSNPNLAQIPSVRKFMGKECRQLFYAPDGYSIVGADASGLELRMLAHYLYPYDNGAYAKVILEGDVHVHNQTAAKLETRDDAKTFIYSFIYGCGPQKTGEQVHPTMSEFEQKVLGRNIQQSFTNSIVGFRELRQAVANAYKSKGILKGIDGRILKPRGEHSALNTLLQGAGAVVCKYWIAKTWQLINKYDYCDIVKPALWVHDEQQLIVKHGYEEKIGEVMLEAIELTGKELKINIPLAGEYKTGKTWYDTH